MAYDDILPGGTTSKMIEVFARDTSTGQGKTGLTYTAVTAKYQREGAAALQPISVVDGTLGTYVSSGWKELGFGWYQFGIPNSALQAGVMSVGLSFHASGMIDIFRRFLLTTSDLRISTPAVAPGANGGLAILDANGNAPADVRRWLNTTPLTLDGQRVQAHVGAMANGVLTTASIAAGAINADALAADAAQEIADALLDRASAIDGYTPRQIMRLVSAALAGKISGAGTTTLTIRDVADTRDRIVATVDADGNRSALTLDAT